MAEVPLTLMVAVAVITILTAAVIFFRVSRSTLQPPVTKQGSHRQARDDGMTITIDDARGKAHLRRVMHVDGRGPESPWYQNISECGEYPRLTKIVTGGFKGEKTIWKVDREPFANLEEAVRQLLKPENGDVSEEDNEDVVANIGGLAIRAVRTGHGQLYEIGNLGLAFGTLEDAIAFANIPVSESREA
jgi:hypothetical protein